MYVPLNALTLSLPPSLSLCLSVYLSPSLSLVLILTLVDVDVDQVCHLGERQHQHRLGHQGSVAAGVEGERKVSVTPTLVTFTTADY